MKDIKVKAKPKQTSGRIINKSGTAYRSGRNAVDAGKEITKQNHDEKTAYEYAENRIENMALKAYGKLEQKSRFEALKHSRQRADKSSKKMRKIKQ